MSHLLRRRRHHHLFIATLIAFLLFSAPTLSQNDTASCPLDFNALRNLLSGTKRAKVPTSQECQYVLQGLRLVQSQYLQKTGLFLPPLNSSESCWRVYKQLVNEIASGFDIRSSCGFQTSWISQGCMNITTRSQFEALVPALVLNDTVNSCNQSLDNNSPCAVCTTSCARLQSLYLTGTSIGNVSTCQVYPRIYAAAFANSYGPTYEGTAKCLFLLDFGSNKSSNKKKKVLILVVIVVCCVGLLVLVGGFWVFRRKVWVFKQGRDRVGGAATGLSSGLESISQSTSLVRFTFDEIRKATRNFTRDNIIGRGGYGNVYKGVLPDGTEVAIKRFKNCSAAGEANFVHEVEVIASVRHVNLVGLRGYCTASTQIEGHQRIIVCDLVKNGSLHDHLFGSTGEKLSWPIRQKIVLGTARGLAYLHFGAQSAIIHRDIKASNILLDERFEPKVADFGLAKFIPEGLTHFSTRVAGTMGYVAPEYTLCGQLTDRSDVYSFGVVLLELLRGRKALMMSEENQPSLVTDWAWSLVREGRSLDVIEDGMPEMGTEAMMEKYVLVAVVCSHPELGARPTMDQVVKMLETDLPVPSIPERPIPIVAELDDIGRCMSSSFSGQLTSPTSYHPYTSETDTSGNKGEGSAASNSRSVE